MLEFGGRLTLFASRQRPAWLAGTAMLALAKIIEMMELGHNISHGQWDWMNDPEIHSTSWEWDFVGSSAHWQRSHNHFHHTYTNVVGMDEDLSFVVMRMTRDEPWRPVHLLQPVSSLLQALRTVHKLALPDGLLRRTVDDAPETRSELKFIGLSSQHATSDRLPADPVTGKRRGLRTALAKVESIRSDSSGAHSRWRAGLARTIENCCRKRGTNASDECSTKG